MAKRQELNSQLRMVSSRVACEVLGVTSQTLRRWAKQGKIGAIKTPGGHYRFDLSGLIVAPTQAAPQPKPKKANVTPTVTSAAPNVTAQSTEQADLVELIAARAAPAVTSGVTPMVAVSPAALRHQIERLASASSW